MPSLDLNHETIVSAKGWDWDWGTSRGHAEESEYIFVKIDFYNNLDAYLAELGNITTDMHSR